MAKYEVRKEGEPEPKPTVCDKCHATEAPCLCTHSTGEQIVQGAAEVLRRFWRMKNGG